MRTVDTCNDTLRRLLRQAVDTDRTLIRERRESLTWKYAAMRVLGGYNIAAEQAIDHKEDPSFNPAYFLE